MSIPPPAAEPRQDFPRVIDPAWEAMMARGEEPETPEWVVEELERRDRMIADGTATVVPWDEVKERLQKRYGLT